MQSALQLVVNNYHKTTPQVKTRGECCICHTSHKKKYAHCLDSLGIFVMEFFDSALDGVDKYGVGGICGHCTYSLSNALFFRFHFSIPFESRNNLSAEQKRDAEFLIIEWLAKQLKKTSEQPSRESDNGTS